MTMPLALENVGVMIAGREIVRDVTIRFEPGRLIALLGPNGAGKTTLLKAVAGLMPSSGSVRIGVDSLKFLGRTEIAKRIGYLPQGHQVHWPMSARDVVALGRFPHGLSDPSRMTAEHASVVNSAMARTKTTSFSDQAVMTLSGGERARVMLARALAVESSILLADEPTASLDPRHQITVMEDLKAETRRGTLVIAVTHDIALAARLADEVVLMHEGRVAAHGPPQDVLTDERLATIYGIKVLRQRIEDQDVITPWGLA